jgi:hypothetical protein
MPLPRFSTPARVRRALAPPRRALPASSPPLGFASATPALAPRIAVAVAAPLRAVVSAEQRDLGMEAGEQGRPLRVGLVCGGPSAERGVSLNSARSVLDHIQVALAHPLAWWRAALL